MFVNSDKEHKWAYLTHRAGEIIAETLQSIDDELSGSILLGKVLNKANYSLATTAEGTWAKSKTRANLKLRLM